MFICVEEMLLTNSLINLTFVISLSQIFKLQLNKVKLIIASLLSAIFSFIFSFSSSIVLSYIVESLIVFFLLSFSIKNCNFKKLTYLSFSFGILSNLFYRFISNYSIVASNKMLIHSSIPTLLFLIILLTFSLIIKLISRLIFYKLKHSANLCKISLKFKGKTISTFGYLDSGNNLTLKDQPVSIINFKLFNQLTNITLADYLSKNYKLTNQDSVSASSVCGNTQLSTFEIEELTINNSNQKITIQKPRLAISLNLSSIKDYDMILNNQYIN